MEKRCYYEVLGVSRQAENGEIKKAFRRLAMEVHPDRNQSDPKAEDKFKEVAEANEVLSDPEKRSLYDRFGHAGPRQAGFEGFSGMGVDDLMSQFADILGFNFGGFGRRGPQVQPGEDMQVVMAISFVEAARGCQKPLQITRQNVCQGCKGTGAKAGTQPSQCSTCGGRGQVGTRRGILTFRSECPSCEGRGQVIRERCEGCRGQGSVGKEESMTITVPPGIDDGQTLRVAGRGHPSPSAGPSGNLYVTFRVEADARFERDGDHLITEVSLSYSQAVLGTTVKVPAINDDGVITIDLEVPPGTQPGDVRVLRGKGLPNVHGRGVGDLAVRFTIAIPLTLTPDQRKLVEDLAKFDGQALATSCAEEPEREGFFRRKKKKR